LYGVLCNHTPASDSAITDKLHVVFSLDEASLNVNEGQVVSISNQVKLASSISPLISIEQLYIQSDNESYITQYVHMVSILLKSQTHHHEYVIVQVSASEENVKLGVVPVVGVATGTVKFNVADDTPKKIKEKIVPKKNFNLGNSFEKTFIAKIY
jgi:allantoicase